MGSASSSFRASASVPLAYSWQSLDAGHAERVEMMETRRSELLQSELSSPAHKAEWAALQHARDQAVHRADDPADPVPAILPGSTVASYIAYSTSQENYLVDTVPSAIATPLQEWAAEGRETAAARPGRVAALDAGSLASAAERAPGATFHALSRSLDDMTPSLYKLAAGRVPAVVHAYAVGLASGGPGLPQQLVPDVASFLHLRDTGAALLWAYTAQEAHDMALAASALASTLHLPVVLGLNAASTAVRLTSTQLLPPVVLREFSSTAAAVSASGPAAAAGAPDPTARRKSLPYLGAADDESSAESATSSSASGPAPTPADVFAKVEEATGRAYAALEYLGPADATHVLVVFGPGAESIAAALPGAAPATGLLRVRLLRPWSHQAFVAALPATTKHVCVVETTAAAGGGVGAATSDGAAEPEQPPAGALFQDVAAAVHTHPPAGRAPPTLAHVSLRLLHSALTPAMAETVVAIGSQAPGTANLRVVDAVSAAAHVAPAAPRTPAPAPTTYTSALLWSMHPSVAAVQTAVSQTAALLAGPLSQQVEAVVAKDLTPNSLVTRAELVFAPASAPPLPTATDALLPANYIAVHHSSLLLLAQYPIFESLAPGGTVFINCPWAPAEVEAVLPVQTKRLLADRKARVVVADVDEVAEEHGLQAVSEPLFQAVFFKLCFPTAPQAIRDGAVRRLYSFETAEAILTAAALLCGAPAPMAGSASPARAKTTATTTPTASLLREVPVRAAWSKGPAFTVAHPAQFGPLAFADDLTPGQTRPTASTHGDGDRYVTLLGQLFGERAVVADARSTDSLFGQKFAPSSAGAHSIDTIFSSKPEFCFGVHLARQRQRQNLVSSVDAFLAEDATFTNAELHRVLSEWRRAKDDAVASRVLGEQAAAMLAALPARPGQLAAIYAAREFFPKHSKWIVGSDTWATDIGYSGIHHVMASGEDVNVLVIETTPYAKGSRAGADALSKTKKDIGLYAMNYGNTYVASVSLDASHTQAVRAFTEADAFRGPSIILAYAPEFPTLAASGGDPRVPAALAARDREFQAGAGSTSAGSDVASSLAGANVSTTGSEAAASTAAAVSSIGGSTDDTALAAVQAGLWPLYRWNPALADEQQQQEEGGLRQPFQLDSKKLRQDLDEFVKRRTHLSLLVSKEPQVDARLHDSLEQNVREASSKLQEQLSQLEASAAGTVDLSLLIVFGSDGGNAGGLAKRLQAKAEKRRVREVKCVEANSCSLEELCEADAVAFVISTAGQGEAPGNAKQLLSELLKAGKSQVQGLRYAVFGLGDSAYWGAGTADSAKYFCLPARDLDAHLSTVVAEGGRLLPVGLGDDQHANGYEGAFVSWQEALFDELKVAKVAGEDEDSKPVGLVDEIVKGESNYLRGTLAESLSDPSTGSILPEDTKLTKFMGIYQQDDRDAREELVKNGQEKAYSFMIRVGLPGGDCTPEMFLAMLGLTDSHANGVLKLTTRQAFQLHGVIKKKLKPTIQEINRNLMDTMAACGDVCRNVMACPFPVAVPSTVYQQVQDFAHRLSAHLKPQTTAYAEIFLDKKPVFSDANVEVEPLYGKSYLPRKFKVAIAVPPHNDVDCFAHCVGFIAIVVNNQLMGYNVSVGGGMGMTHGNKKTYPRLGDLLGFVSTTEEAITVCEKIMLVQRDHGDRVNRKHARLKYTLEDLGMEYFRGEVERRAGFKLGQPRPFKFVSNGDPYGWHEREGKHLFCMYIENGKISGKTKAGLREVAQELQRTGGSADFRLTPNQGLMIGGMSDRQRAEVQRILAQHGLDNRQSGIRLNSLACASLPYCALAMAESQRYMPKLLDKIDVLLDKHGLFNEPIVARMTGCPNGCARPYVAEIAFVGKAPNTYVMYLGGGFSGNRLAKMYRENVTEEEILALLDPLFARFAKDRLSGEHFGDWCVRANVVAPTLTGNMFHELEKEKNLAVKTPSGTTDIYW